MVANLRTTRRDHSTPQPAAALARVHAARPAATRDTITAPAAPHRPSGGAGLPLGASTVSTGRAPVGDGGSRGASRHRHQRKSGAASTTLVGGLLGAALLAALSAGGIALRGGQLVQAAPVYAAAPAWTGAARIMRVNTAAVPVAEAAALNESAAGSSSPGVEVEGAASAAPPEQTEPRPLGSDADANATTVAAAPPVVSVTNSNAVVVAAPSPVAAVANPNGAVAAVIAVPTPVAPPPLERTHAVVAGETLSTIAQRYQLQPDSLVINNAGVTDRDLLKVGESLRVPPHDGLLYEVRFGESLTSIAGRHGIDPAAVMAEPANRLASADRLREGQVVLLPGVKPVPAQRAAVVAPTAIVSPLAPAALRPAALNTATAPFPTPALRPPATTSEITRPSPLNGWIWPIRGPLSSYFGPGHPLGIDVDLYGRAGAPVVAARGGTVMFAGGNPCCSYGYYVEIDHGDGFRSLYSHFNAPPPVRIGQMVGQGEIVGYAGTTGYSTGVHLHFEIRRGGVPVNPLGLLP